MRSGSFSGAIGSDGIKVLRTLGYIRVSSRKQDGEGASPEKQLEDFERHVGGCNLPPLIIYKEVESATEAKEESRVKIAALLADVRPGDMILVAALDRFSRDTLFALKSFRAITRNGAIIYSLREGEFNNSEDSEMRLLMWAMHAQREHTVIVKRTKENKARLRSMGLFVEGNPPFGYQRAEGRGKNKPRKLVIDETAAQPIRAAFDLCIRGRTAREISAYLRAHFPGPGMRRFGSSWVLYVLRNRIYTGQLALTPVRPTVNRNGPLLPAEWVEAHEPIVSLETFLRAQDSITSRVRRSPNPKLTSLSWLLPGFMVCGTCGHVCTPRLNSGKRVHHDGYYVCCRHLEAPESTGVRCSAKRYARRDEADRAVGDAVVARLVDLRSLLTQPPAPPPDMPDFDKARADVDARRKRLVGALESGVLSVDDVKARVAALDGERASIEAQAAGYRARSVGDTDEARGAALARVEVIAAAWERMTVPERREVLALLATRIVLPDDGAPVVTWADASAVAAAPAARPARPAPVPPSRERTPGAPWSVRLAGRKPGHAAGARSTAPAV